MSTGVEMFDVGYALAEKKQKSFVQPSLIAYAKSKGVNLVCVDFHKSLEEQGPFDAIIHKHGGELWTQQLLQYKDRHPDVVIIDPPAAIAKLQNRISMLQAVEQVQISTGLGSCGIPKQLIVDSAEMLHDDSALSELTFPVIAKPMVADGSAKSHAMFLLFNTRGLNKLKPPMVLQEFVNHGGVIFKVYVVGKYIKCVRRKSLPDVNEEQVSTDEPLPFSQISNMVSGATMDENVAKAELPPANFIADVANGLREALGLRLFNFDVIKDLKAGNHFHVIDINYFPGYAKMPSYETVLTDFLLDLRHEKASDSNSDSMSLASIASKLGVSVEEV
ncbi:inositol-tetrakisphosphate 1-kinase 1 [Physcomitrium patens]|uniref:Inositol-tetrakisphosphate 1-kinase n=1 Tax=Physcomitrium patens TaxID=3218 RepID=A9SU45_PHYPA|nr:inositol-tetrakisphosphate 1-kinase 1-like [Physcomitrium patens]PNR60422.1 hypothetical protein PHYPA_003215 [Physcomitrium patens]|eukprot:XP_024356898.1 inositol-tetrakisphosphate 1-kinase 1-like [Physcomitrella patens]